MSQRFTAWLFDPKNWPMRLDAWMRTSWISPLVAVAIACSWFCWMLWRSDLRPTPREYVFYCVAISLPVLLTSLQTRLRQRRRR